MSFLFEILRLGLTNLMLHKLRSLLTALGIICGVAAVITMVAIGEGNKRKALADIRQLGARNIIVRSIKPEDPNATGSGSRSYVLWYGLRRQDLRRIERSVKPVARIVASKNVANRVSQGVGSAVSPAEVIGTSPQLLEVTSLGVERGRYLTQEDLDNFTNVAVIGASVAERLFPLEDPLEGSIRVHNYRNNQLFKVVGVLKPVGLAGGAGSALVGRDLNFDVHIPISTATSRFGDILIKRQSGSFEGNGIELSELYIQAPHEDDVIAVADQVRRTLELNHEQQNDVTTIVPMELLEQTKRTMRMFNALMTAIAAISLLVGGIGIMNIMLASVTERTREIGIRRALGATRGHIVAQFLVETTTLSGLGGLIGIVTGLAFVAALIAARRWIPALEQPAVEGWSIIVSFIVATLVGIVFGLYPAIKASLQDPIVALRHD
jgi:putative ABC transport system permease protein